MQQEIAKVRLPKEFPRLGVAKYLQKLTVSCTFFYEYQKFYKALQIWFSKKNVTQKHLPLQPFATSTSFRKVHFKSKYLREFVCTYTAV